MNRALAIVSVLAVTITASAVTATVLIMRNSCGTVMSDEQRAAREKFFGAGDELPPIKKGQEMRPRW